MMPKLMFLLLLAQGDPTQIPGMGGPSSKIYNWSVRDMILVVGVTVVIANLLFLWVYLSRRNRRRQFGPYSLALHKNEKGSSSRSHSRRHRRKRRPNHPANLPRNPSLAEAGGLPPLRQDEPPPAKSAT